jgi:hypothetical protein
MSVVYPLAGGLMLASSVYHLLYFNGNVLGISGIYRSTISQILNKARLVSTGQQPMEADNSAKGTEWTQTAREVQVNK